MIWNKIKMKREKNETKLNQKKKTMANKVASSSWHGEYYIYVHDYNERERERERLKLNRKKRWRMKNTAANKSN